MELSLFKDQNLIVATALSFFIYYLVSLSLRLLGSLADSGPDKPTIDKLLIGSLLYCLLPPSIIVSIHYILIIALSLTLESSYLSPGVGLIKIFRDFRKDKSGTNKTTDKSNKPTATPDSPTTKPATGSTTATHK